MENKDIIKEFYERNDYEEKTKGIIQGGIMGKLFHIFSKYNITRQQICVELIKKYDTQKIYNALEVWVNRGDFLIDISKIIPTIQKYYGIDINKNVLQDAKINLEKNNIACELSCENIDIWLKYNDETMDLISCIAVLEHVFDPITLVQEFNRILKKDGLLVIEVPNIVVFFRRISFLFWNRARTSWDLGWDGWHLQYFTVSDLKNLLQQNGFEVLEISGSWIFARARNWWVSMLSADIIVIAKKK